MAEPVEAGTGAVGGAADPELDFTRWLEYWPEPEVDFKLEPAAAATAEAGSGMQGHLGGGRAGRDEAAAQQGMVAELLQHAEAPDMSLAPGQLVQQLQAAAGAGAAQSSDYASTFGGVPIGGLHAGGLSLGALLPPDALHARGSFDGNSTALLHQGSDFLLSMPSSTGAGPAGLPLGMSALQHHHQLTYGDLGGLPPALLHGQLFGGPVRPGTAVCMLWGRAAGGFEVVVVVACHDLPAMTGCSREGQRTHWRAVGERCWHGRG